MDTVSQLAERQMFLRDRITAISMGATAKPGEDIRKLALEAARVKQQLEQARIEADERAREHSRREAEARRVKLEAALVTAATQKENFAALYRSACLALGTYCAAMDEAITMANSLAGALGPAPLDTNRIAELKQNLDPLARLTLEGLQPTLSFGWNLSSPVIPLQELGKVKR